MKNILEYDLYLFDFDGTIVDTEKLHYKSYMKAFNNVDNNFYLTYDQYCEYKHNNSKFVYNFFDDDQLEEINIMKEKYFFESLEETNIELIKGIEQFIELLIHEGKNICVVTHSSLNRVEAIKIKIPFLYKITKWITKENYKFKKPHPESYIKAINNYDIQLDRIIAFEDSYNGFSSIAKLNITRVLINNNNYIFYDKINCNNKFDDYHDVLKYGIINNNDNLNNIGLKIDRYIQQINDAKSIYIKNICIFTKILKECKGNIYILGVGKNRHLANKCASTWNSYGINVSTLNAQDLFHGDFGTLKKGDCLIHISNSGNTIELVDVAKYIKNNFEIYQIEISNNDNNKLTKYVDINLKISNNKIIEADNINMAPTVSSVMLMIFIDLIGINYAEECGYTVDEFKLYHPGGELGFKKVLDYVFIFAAGKGSRLKPYTNNIPKFLVDIDNQNLLSKIINYWNKFTDKFVIIVNEEYNDMVKYYLEQICSYEIININIESQENSYTIKKAISSKYFGKNILFTWCDIYPDEDINDSIFSNKNIIFTHGNQCRYKAESDKIYKCNDGNIIGIYYFYKYKPLTYQEDNMDLCDCYSKNYSKFIIYDIKKIIDIGDLEKYMNINNKKNIYITRSFNQIDDVGDNMLIKKSLNNIGDKLISLETNWYKINNYNFLPKIYKYDDKYFIMEKLVGYDPLYKSFYKFDKEEKKIILDKILDNLMVIHAVKKNIDNMIIQRDIKYEFYDKVLSRYDDIRLLIGCFDIKSINNITINISLNEILENIYVKLATYFSQRSEFNIIHGDCQFSNILYNGREIKFIDPRGYFGNTYNYGLSEYDYSKIIYALTGYDFFNNNLSFINIIDKNINININIDMESIIYFSNKIKVPVEILYDMVIIHWLGVAQYNKNSISKCINSYYTGLYLYINGCDKKDN